MKNEDKIVGLLSELVRQNDGLNSKIGEMVKRQDEMVKRQDEMSENQRKTNEILIRHELILKTHDKDLKRIIQILEQDTPRFDKVVKIEKLPAERYIIRKLPPEKV